MKHFFVEITYTFPFELVAPFLQEHRAFLQTGYDRGMLLLSGPMNPRTGGVVIARAAAIEEVQSFFAQDPYRLRGVAEHRIVEFEPVKRQPFLDGWVEGR